MPRFFRQLIAEIRRREVIPVIVTYAVAGWLILQIAGLTFEPLGVPDWGMRVLIIVTIAGFPAVFFIAWLIDFNDKGMMFDIPVWRSTDYEESASNGKSGRLLAVFLCVLVVIGTVGLVFVLLEAIPASKQQPPEETAVEIAIEKPTNSIAVLAFDNFYGQSEDDYFSAGLAEEILNFLAAIRELNVAARTSSFRFQGEQVDIREVAELLNVKYVLEGSVRREGVRVRVTAQLIDGEKGYHAWSKTYDRTLDDIFAIQQEIGAAVVNELKIVLSVASETRLQETRYENIDAYVFYLQGREKLRSSQDEDVIRTAMQLFNQALDIDESYARAYAGLCEVQLRLYEITNDINAFSEAQVACEQAQTLDDELSLEVKIALGRLYRYRGWYDKAVEQLNQAIDASPTAVDAFIELGEIYRVQNMPIEAENQFLRAIDLKRNYWKAHEALANFYYGIEQYAQSASSYRTVTALTPDSAVGFTGFGAALWMQGETQKALLAYEQSLALKPTRLAYTNLATSYYYAGQFEKAVNVLQQALAIAPDDHRIWGRLAENYRFIPGKENEAQHGYFRAAELASSNLAINSEDWLTRGFLGLYQVHLKQQSEGFVTLTKALEQSDENSEVLYFHALALLQVDKADEAIAALKMAVTIDDYYRQFIAMDPDLQSLRGNPEFERLLPK